MDLLTNLRRQLSLAEEQLRKDKKEYDHQVNLVEQRRLKDKEKYQNQLNQMQLQFETMSNSVQELNT